VIASDRSCIPTVCGDGAVLLPPTSSQLWAEQMNRLLADGQYHATLAAASRRRGQAFSWQQTWRELDDAFSTALRVEPSRGPALTHCPEAVAYDIGKS
jgi:glycosyltransferase involved in cell wall biosynthesis